MATRRDDDRVVPIDERDQSTVRALILARTSRPGGAEDDVKSQVDQCLAFIKEMGWTLIHPENPSKYMETKSGMKQVRRPVLDQVLKMAERREVDVIVCLKLARIDRRPDHRSWAMKVAQDFGVEFRFVDRPETRGRIPDDELAIIRRALDDIFDEHEARAIVERLTPAKLMRHQLGLPHGGSNGPNYGYKPGIRQYKTLKSGGQGRPMGLLTWEIDEPKAAVIRWLFETIDQTDMRDLTIRGLVRTLETGIWQGRPTPFGRAPTATGKGHWSTTALLTVLRNGKYAGVGLNLRYQVLTDKIRDSKTNRVFDTSRTTFREGGTYPVSPEAIPSIIDIDVWNRVQAKLDKLKDEHNRGERVHSERPAPRPLLDKGYVRCGHCHSKLTAFWDKRQGRGHYYYKCIRQAGTPGYECAPHTIRTDLTDELALRLLAIALTDPEKILELAAAAEDQYEEASTEAALAEASYAAYTKRLESLREDQAKLRKVLDSLVSMQGVEELIASTRLRIQELDREFAEATAEVKYVLPYRDRANERQAFLRQVFTTREWVFDFRDGPEHVTMNTLLAGPGTDVTAYEAAKLLGVSEAELATMMPVKPGEVVREIIDGEYSAYETEPSVQRDEVVYCLLRRRSRDGIRKLLQDLDAAILVRRPRSREEWHQLGDTPAEDRVSLQILGAVEVRLNATKISALL